MMQYIEYKNFCKVLNVPTVARKRFANEFADNPKMQACHLLYWQHRNAGNGHKQACQFCDDVLPIELTDECIAEYLAMIAPFPSPSFRRNGKAGDAPVELTFIQLVRKYEELTGKRFTKFCSKEKLIAMIQQAEVEASPKAQAQMASTTS